MPPEDDAAEEEGEGDEDEDEEGDEDEDEEGDDSDDEEGEEHQSVNQSNDKICINLGDKNADRKEIISAQIISRTDKPDYW